MDFSQECTGQQARKGKKIYESLICSFIFICEIILCLDVGNWFQWDIVGKGLGWETTAHRITEGTKKEPQCPSLHNSKRYQQTRRRLFHKISLNS